MRKLLLVDDSDFMSFCFAEYLTAQGFRVETALSVRAAVRKLRTFNPDLIVLEIGIGEIEGVGFLRRLPGRDGNLMWPVIVHTLRPEMEEFCRSIGVADFVLKTGHGEVLLEAIRSAVAQRVVAAEQEAGPAPAPAPARGLVLLGEDDAALADSLVRAFAQSGFAVTVAATGPALFEEAQGALPVAIVVKEVLSGMNGRLVAARLAATERLRRVPVVLYDDSHELDDAVGWQKVSRNVKSVLFTREPALLIDAVEKSAHLKAG